MSEDTVLIIGVVILCAGDPDLLDALIKFIMSKANCGA